MYRDEQSGASFMLGMLTGAFVGAGLALLFAPKPGHEIRHRLGEQYRGLADRMGEQAQGLKTSAERLREQGRERMEQLRRRRYSDRTTTDVTEPAVTSEGESFTPSTPGV